MSSRIVVPMLFRTVAKFVVLFSAILFPAMGQATTNFATVQYDLTVAGLSIASIEDAVLISSDSSYKITSKLNANGVLKWFWPDPIVRMSSGTVDHAKNIILIEKYSFNNYKETLGFEIDRTNAVIDFEYEGWITQAALPKEAELLPIHDSLTLAYNHFLLNNSEADVGSYIFMDGKRTRIHVWKRATSSEFIDANEDKYETVRYDRHKNGELHTSIWYVPELDLLPGLAAIHIARNLVLRIKLTGYSFASREL